MTPHAVPEPVSPDLEALSDAATPGPWRVRKSSPFFDPDRIESPDEVVAGSDLVTADAAFIVALVNAYREGRLAATSGLVVGELDEAWAAAEKALPDGWEVRLSYVKGTVWFAMGGADSRAWAVEGWWVVNPPLVERLP